MKIKVILTSLILALDVQTQAASEEPCVAAPDGVSAKALVCSNQKRYTFMEIVGGNLGSPESLAFVGRTSSGTESFRLSGPEVIGRDIIYRNSDVKFQGIDLNSTPPQCAVRARSSQLA